MGINLARRKPDKLEKLQCYCGVLNNTCNFTGKYLNILLSVHEIHIIHYFKTRSITVFFNYNDDECLWFSWIPWLQVLSLSTPYEDRSIEKQWICYRELGTSAKRALDCMQLSCAIKRIVQSTTALSAWRNIPKTVYRFASVLHILTNIDW